MIQIQEQTARSVPSDLDLYCTQKGHIYDREGRKRLKCKGIIAQFSAHQILNFGINNVNRLSPSDAGALTKGTSGKGVKSRSDRTERAQNVQSDLVSTPFG